MAHRVQWGFAVATASAMSAIACAQLAYVDQTEACGLACDRPGTGFGQFGGVTVADFNNDGHPDLYVLCAGEFLYVNDGNGNFTDQAPQWGLNGGFVGAAAAAGDFNGDGWIDIYVTSNGPISGPAVTGVHRLYRNNGGQSFTNIAVSAGVNYTSTNEPGGYGIAWGDYDLDGDLDLSVLQWTGNTTSSEHNRLFRNNGNETFTDVTLAAVGSSYLLHGFQPCFADMNGDRFPELLWAVDYEDSRYFVNNGNGTFTDQTVAAGLGLDDNGMGQTVGDVNNDLRPDWYVTSIHYGFPIPNNNPGNMLYINQGNNIFTEVSVAAGCNDGGWGWGTIAADVDMDGWQDLIEVNGRASPIWDNEQAYLFHNTTTVPGASPTFQEMALACGFVHYANQTSVVAFDADGDGDLDIVSYAVSGLTHYFENQTTSPGNWLKIDFDTSNNAQLAPNGFGTRVEITANGMSQMRIVDGRPSYLASSGTTVHFGLGSATVINTLRVKWARGYDTVYTNVPVNQTLEIVSPRLGDVNGNGSVNVTDLFELLAHWGACPGGTVVCTHDLNNDHTVNVSDLFLLLANWG